MTSRSVEVGGGLASLIQMATFQNYSCLSALIVLLWDHMDTVADEVQYIWSLPLSQAKVTFFVARYFGVLAQLGNLIFTFTALRSLDFPVPHDICRTWYLLQLLAFCVLYAAGDLILMRRVYDLCGKSPRIGVVLAIVLSGEVMTATICSKRTLDALKFDSHCNSIHIPKDGFVVLAVMIFTQCVIWTLTFYKRDLNSKPGEKARMSISLMGDGKWAWVLMSCTFAAVIPSSFARQIARPHLIFSWPITMLSTGTCRLILNREKRARLLAMRLSQFELQYLPPSQLPPAPLKVHQEPSSDLSKITAPPSIDLPATEFLSDHSNQSNVCTAGDDSSVGRGSSRTTNADGEDDDDDYSLDTESVFDSASQRSHSFDIEIGSLHTSSSMNSEGMRMFWNEAWNPTP